jgi:hypothetical protein
MGVSPWSQGDNKPVWTFALEPDSDNFDTTGLSVNDFTLVMINVSNQQITIGTGTFSNLLNSIPASITYQLSSTDAAMLGMYDMRIVVKKGTINQQTFKFGIWSNES